MSKIMTELAERRQAGESAADIFADLMRNGKISKGLDFENSTLKGYKKAQNLIRRIVNRFEGSVGSTALDAHRAKRFIDTQVTYGKLGDNALDAQTETLIKNFRRAIDGILDNRFPDYDEANTAYSETIRVLDDVQSLAGAKVDLLAENAPVALGKMSRKVLSNYNTGVPIENTLKEIDRLAEKYSSPLGARIGASPTRVSDASVLDLVGFETELKRIFGAQRKNQFQSEIGQEIQRGVRGLRSPKEYLMEKAVDKVAGPPSSPEIIQSMRDLLYETSK